MIDAKVLLAEKRKYGLSETIAPQELQLLANDVPVQKIIGYVELANVKIDLSHFVLIPRYETEELVFLALELIQKHKLQTVLDLGCGSGFIGIAIKRNLPDDVTITLSDVDPQAITQTQINLALNGVQAEVIQSDWFAQLDNKRFDLIISNPPYLKFSERATMSPSVLKHEPHHALFAKQAGLEYYQLIEKHLNQYLNTGGFILLEINPLNQTWFVKHHYHILHDINQKARFAWKQKLD